jgi:hypothetical protein
MEAVLGLFALAGPELAAGAGSAVGAAELLPAVGGWSTLVTPAAGSSALGVLQGVATAGSMLSAGVGGLAALGQGLSRGALSDVEAEQERLAGEERAIRLKRELVQKIGANRVAFAASGVQIGSGDALEGSLRSEAEFETQLAGTNARIKQLAAEQRADQYRFQGYAGALAAAGKIGALGANYGLDIARRG